MDGGAKRSLVNISENIATFYFTAAKGVGQFLRWHHLFAKNVAHYFQWHTSITSSMYAKHDTHALEQAYLH